jgi:hypothetical protein
VRIAIGAVVVAALGAIGATVWLGARVREDTVVRNPYEEGLKLTRAGARGEPAGRATDAPAGAAACDLGAGPCAAALPGGGEVRLELGPRPLRTMADLAVRVELAAAQPDPAAVSVSFSMRGMSMGENRSRLARTAPGRWEGKAVLVRCSSGRREWLADVEVAAAGAAPRAARFALTVAE